MLQVLEWKCRKDYRVCLLVLCGSVLLLAAAAVVLVAKNNNLRICRERALTGYLRDTCTVFVRRSKSVPTKSVRKLARFCVSTMNHARRD